MFVGTYCEQRNACYFDQPCKNDGVCYLSSSELGYSCFCGKGWTGQTCEIELSCNTLNCGNGSCVDDYAVRCKCNTGYTGENCEIETPCASISCENNGISSLLNLFYR